MNLFMENFELSYLFFYCNFSLRITNLQFQTGFNHEKITAYHRVIITCIYIRAA